MIAIIDYQVGNLQSVRGAFERAGAEVQVTADPELISQADGIVLPGVGSFPVGMEHLRARGLPLFLRQRADDGVPLLGICLGMQLLFDAGDEGGATTPGLGLLSGVVRQIPTTAKLPHIGWNQLQITPGSSDGILADLKTGDEMYFVHSYYADCPASVVIASTEYGGVRIPAVVGRKNVLGCQFHPEKSSRLGQLIINSFVSMTATT